MEEEKRRVKGRLEAVQLRGLRCAQCYISSVVGVLVPFPSPYSWTLPASLPPGTDNGERVYGGETRTVPSTLLSFHVSHDPSLSLLPD